MAIVASNLTADKVNSVTVTSQATASITPTSNYLILLSVTSRTAISANPNQPTATGNGLTWVVINSVIWDSTSSSRKRLTLLRAMGASPSTGAITIDFGGQNQTDINWSVDQVSGIDISGTNGSGAVVQSATNKDESGTAATLTVALSGFGSTDNGTFGVLSGDGTGTNTFSAGTGFSSIGYTNGNLQLAPEWKNSNDTSVDGTFSGNCMLGGIAIEIKAAVSTVVKDMLGGFIPFNR